MSRPLESDLIDTATGEVLSRRSLPQNARLHAMLTDISEQVEWCGQRLDMEGWKRLTLGAFYGQLCLPNPFDPQGAPVVVNKRRSSKLSKSGDDSMADYLTQLEAFGVERGVKWSNGQ
jgi:hypothetical protein